MVAEATDARRAADPPLTGVRVLEAGTGVSSGYCGQILADMGADVIRYNQQYSSLSDDRDEPYRSALHRTLHRNKSLASDNEVAWRDAIGWADIAILEGTKEEIEARLPPSERPRGLVVAAISAFGIDGPRSHWKGTELVSCGYGGGCQHNGESGRAPLAPPAFAGDYETGVSAAVAALIALVASRRDGIGQFVDISAAGSWATIQTAVGLLEFIFRGEVAQRSGRTFHGRPYPYTILPCRDADVRVLALTGHEWRRELDMMGNPAWARDPRYADRLKNARVYTEELNLHLERWLADHDSEAIMDLALEHKVPWAPIRQVDELLEDSQLRSRGFFWDDNGVRLPGFPARFSRTPAKFRNSAAKASGDFPRVRLEARPHEQSAEREQIDDLPLKGVRVLDFGWAWAGGLVGSLMADFGAEVIKVESRHGLDPMRQDRPLIGTDPDPEQGGLHHNVNRNKKSVSIDLKHPEGPGLVRRLVTEVDVLVENFSPGVMARFGLGHEDLCSANGRLIYLSLGAVGSSGPLTGIRAYAPVVTALAGMDSLVGYEGERPIGQQHALSDPNASLHGLAAVLASLLERERSGCGQHIDFSQYEALVSILAPHVVAQQISGGVPATLGNGSPLSCPRGVYPALGDDQWVAIECDDDEAWVALRHVMGNPAWASESSYGTLAGRQLRRAEIDGQIAAWTASTDAWRIASQLQAMGVPAGPLLDTGQRFADEHLQARHSFTPVEHPVVGTEFVYGVPWRLSRTPGSVRTAAPLLGEHTKCVLSELLGLDDSHIEQLDREGVLR